VALTREMRDECTVFVGKLQIRRPFGKPMRRLGFIIMDLLVIRLEWGGVRGLY
jgi:cytochrome b